uniref:Bardet-Biedl syndrome 10 n=1 Tax=Neogobius melanostomus TaxID=47308 RepID=A0A8C6SZC7_9GOBI
NQQQHVAQTVGALEAVVLRAFGPHGGQVLFTRDTGQAMLSRGGARILTALRLDNPLAKMIVDCASTHSARTGDGSKTFVLLLASLVRMIDAAAYKDPLASHSHCSREDVRSASARRLADELLSFSLQQLDDLLTVEVLPFGQHLMWQDLHSTSPIQKFLSSFFYTRLGYNNCSFISGLLCELLSNWTSKDNTPFSSLEFVNDTWPALYTPVTGFPLAYSRLVEGQVIIETLDAGNRRQWGYFALGVSVLFSSVKQSVTVLALTAQAQIHVVECISQDELALFRHLSGAKPVSDYWSIQSEHVVPLEFCKPILLGAHRYTKIFDKSGGIDSAMFMVMFVKCFNLLTPLSPNNSLTSSASCCQTFPQGYVIAAGGTFEFLLSHALQQKTFSRNVSIVSQILADSLLCVPRHIYSHHPRRFAQVQSEVLKRIQEHGASPMHCQTNAPVENSVHFKAEFSTLDSGLESVFCKYQLLLAVLQCLSRLFRIDAVIHTRGLLKTISRTNISWEDSEGELEN